MRPRDTILAPTVPEDAAPAHPYREPGTVATVVARLPRVSLVIGGTYRVVRTDKTRFVFEQLTRDAMGVERWIQVLDVEAAGDAPSRFDDYGARELRLFFATLNEVDVLRHGSVP